MGRGRGIYRKFKVTRTDGQHKPGKKHERCRYFVLDLDCDPHAKRAIKAYAKSCANAEPQLSADLLAWLDHGEIELD